MSGSSLRPARRPGARAAVVLAALCTLALASPAPVAAQISEEPSTGACQNRLTAEVVALDQVFFWNRLGAVEPQGMIYALADDVVHVSQDENTCPFAKDPLAAGQVKLRKGKRPRPLVLRMNVGDCLEITFHNYLANFQKDEEQPATREASIHVVGMQYEQAIQDGGMWVGVSPSGLVPSGGSTKYRIYAEKEGTFLMYSGAAMVGGQGDGGSISAGLFGAINVQPQGARYFRSQVTRKELALARTDGGTGAFPTLDYGATFPTGSSDPDLCFREGKPILEMTQGGEIVHSDLTAIITGPGLFGFDDYPYPLNDPTYPHRNEPYREFTIVFHDEIGAVQAFPQFEDRILQHTLHSVRDAFAINYGTGGIGAEILANRFELGPMADCIDCKYEEFFLASWAVGDPAMVVDRPANYPCGKDAAGWKKLREGDHSCTPDPGKKATKAFYPDDPSNVYHSYMNDRVKFRNLHAGTDDHHIFHLHAHQWLHTPKSTKSSYMDSQAIGQASSFTYEIAYEGSGNRNKTVGDSIFHCHFYPHFAQGMWSLWRVHDVLELGTELNAAGEPVHEHVDDSTVVTQTRALPDGEIATGTPIPAIVPLPGKALPPPPTAIQLVNGQIDEDYVLTAANAAQAAGSDYFNPGFPFYIPGRAGHRAPHPPLDFAVDEATGAARDGGLPRHVVLNDADEDYVSSETRLDFHKEVLKLRAKELPEDGTDLEKLAMVTHERRWYDTPTANGVLPPRQFELNGAPRQPGAPYAEPCWDRDAWTAIPVTKHYEAVDLELDVIFNKAGWHFPQQRLITLRQDMPATLAGTRPPEPLFFRANSKECIEYELTNLVPFEYQVDDFQVRTPTDILGQHIHLVKFDVTSSDGGGNGFNYEDGSFSPEEVQERIHAIRELNAEVCGGGLVQTTDPETGELLCPEAEIDPRFGAGPDRNCNDYQDYVGAQTTVQRWWADPVEDPDGNDRTLRTVFTHDHFGPSTHQQAGLYAGLVIEPEGSTWYHNEKSERFYTREDGGPTSWQARILTADPAESYREFMLEYADFQLAYEPNEVAQFCPDPTIGWADPENAINPPGRKAIEPPILFQKPNPCPINENDPDGAWPDGAFSPAPPPPCPEAVSADDPGMWVMNYRNEPLALRIGTDPNTGPRPPTQVSGVAGDPSFAYESRTDRANPELNVVPDGSFLTYVDYPALTGGLHPGDPFTPVMRVYEGDPVQIRTLVGAHEEEHDFSIHGLKWLFEPFDPASGYRNSQMAGISEWFDFIVPPMPNLLGPNEEADFLVKPNSSAEGQWSGVWGLLRLLQDSNQERDAELALPALPSNPDGLALTETEKDEAFEEVPEEEVLVTDSTSTTSLESKASTSNNVRVGCPPGSFPPRTYDVTAVAAREVLPTVPALGQPSLVYNRRDDTVRWWDDDDGGFSGTRSGPLHDPTAILFVETQDLIYGTGPNPRPTLAPDAPVEPLILRARKGECVKVVLRNDLPDPGPFAYDLPGWNGWLMLLEGFNANQVAPSREVGLHPQLVQYDLTRADGANIGRNPFHHGKQTVAPGERVTYFWYAGEVTRPQGGPFQIRPLELGTTGLSSSDTLKHSNKGAIGALIIEPADAEWDPILDTHQYLDPTVEPARRTRAEATVTTGSGSFREYVTFFQDDVNLRYSDVHERWLFAPVENLSVNEDPTESAQKAFGYRTEPIWFREGWSPNTPETFTRDQQFADTFTDGQIGGQRPVTHIFDAEPAQDVRFRTVHVGGHTQSHVFEVQGHLWPELPFNADSSTLQQRSASEYQGARHGVGPTCHYDALILDGAGGELVVSGEYLYRDYVAWGTDGGMWGIFNVETGSTP